MPKRSRKILIIGHKNPDTDSICSAICYARFKKLLTKKDYLAKRAGQLNAETQYVLERFGVAPPEYISDVRTQIKDVEYRETAGVDGDISLKKAWQLMKDNNVTTLPITEKDRLTGLITIGDIATSYMDVYDSKILSTSSTSYRNILEKMQDMPIEEPEPDERDGLKKALFEPACLMEPMEDDGTEIPEDYLQKEISIRERGVMRLYRAGKELEAEVMAGADTERVRLSRGGFRDQETWRRNSIYVQGRIAASLPHSTRILAGYGMQEGRLVLRIFVPEMLEDLKIVLTCTEEGIFGEFYDVHNPAEPVKL